MNNVKRLTRSEYYQLCGMLYMAKRHRSIMEDLYTAICEITKENKEDFGYCSDYVWGDEGDANSLLDTLGIEVADE